jgi:hypothetical protein
MVADTVTVVDGEDEGEQGVATQSESDDGAGRTVRIHRGGL